MTISHDEQRMVWDEEHKKPTVLLQMDSRDASSGVRKFFDFLTGENAPHDSGIEMGCGKGRNVIWLATQGIRMEGFDFSPTAIEEAVRRAKEAGVEKTAQFRVGDATERWPYPDGTFDFGIDCFASTDIESKKGREFAIAEMYRVLKPGGYLLAYLLSTDDEFHKEMIESHPADERNALIHPTGKFEKTYDEAEVRELFVNFSIARLERLPKTAIFAGKEYACNHFWIVLQKRAK